MIDHPAHTPASRPFLVAIGDSHALVDASNGRLLVLNEQGARVWRALEKGALPRTAAEHAFLADVERPESIATAPKSGDGPRIVASAPLQVAANTSDPNPFSADSGW